MRNGMKSCSRIIQYLIILNIVEALFLGLVFIALDYQSQMSVASRLQISPGWDNFSRYVDSHLRPGVTRLNLLREADKIGPFTLEVLPTQPPYCERLQFKVGPLGYYRGGKWLVCYDENYNVIKVEQYFYQ